LSAVRNAYNGPPSPLGPWIAPRSITPDPAPKILEGYEGDFIRWNQPMSTDYDDVVNHNNTWAYVPSLPLCVNIVLIDPSTAEHSVDSRIVACICKVKIDSNSSDLFPNCAACEHKSDKETNGTIQWIMDSGASIAFTSMTSDFCDLIYYKPNRRPAVSTANGIAYVLGFGTVFIQTTLDGKTIVTRVHPVLYLPSMTERLLSLGQILRGNLRVYGDENTLTFTHVELKEIVLQANSGTIHENIYWVDTQIVSGNALTVFSTIHADDYETWHRRLGHPSDQVLIKFKTKTQNFPSDLFIPKESPICKGCAKGKMRSRPFPGNPSRSTKPFERIHSDL